MLASLLVRISGFSFDIFSSNAFVFSSSSVACLNSFSAFVTAFSFFLFCAFFNVFVSIFIFVARLSFFSFALRIELFLVFVRDARLRAFIDGRDALYCDNNLAVLLFPVGATLFFFVKFLVPLSRFFLFSAFLFAKGLRKPEVSSKRFASRSSVALPILSLKAAEIFLFSAPFIFSSSSLLFVLGFSKGSASSLFTAL